MFDTRVQQSMIGRDGWEIIKRHDTWIDAQVINTEGSSKEGRYLKGVDARGVVKYHLDGKRYLVILRQSCLQLKFGRDPVGGRPNQVLWCEGIFTSKGIWW